VSADDALWEATTGNGFRVRLEPNGASPTTLRLTVTRVLDAPSPGRGRRRIQPVLDVRQAEELGRVLVSWAADHPATDAELLADRLRSQSFDPRSRPPSCEPWG